MGQGQDLMVPQARWHHVQTLMRLGLYLGTPMPQEALEYDQWGLPLHPGLWQDRE